MEVEKVVRRVTSPPCVHAVDVYPGEHSEWVERRRDFAIRHINLARSVEAHGGGPASRGAEGKGQAQIRVGSWRSNARHRTKSAGPSRRSWRRLALIRRWAWKFSPFRKRTIPPLSISPSIPPPPLSRVAKPVFPHCAVCVCARLRSCLRPLPPFLLWLSGESAFPFVPSDPTFHICPAGADSPEIHSRPLGALVSSILARQPLPPSSDPTPSALLHRARVDSLLSSRCGGIWPRRFHPAAESEKAELLAAAGGTHAHAPISRPDTPSLPPPCCFVPPSPVVAQLIGQGSHPAYHFSRRFRAAPLSIQRLFTCPATSFAIRHPDLIFTSLASDHFFHNHLHRLFPPPSRARSFSLL